MLQLHDIRLSTASSAPFDHAFAPGEITVVLGANQSGKTNLCRLIAGLHSEAHGRIA
ncbi:MAG: ABC transporter ATP-binding protein, partial [Pseudomonadota bacterium]